MSETESVVMRLFKFSNINASSIRTIMVADCLSQEQDAVQSEKEKDEENNQRTSQSTVKPALIGPEIANQSGDKNEEETDGNKEEQIQKKKSLSKVQSVQVYENGCLCTKFLELDDEDSNDKLNGTIEYSRDYRMAEGPAFNDELTVEENNVEIESASSRASSELSLHTSSSSLKDMDNGACIQSGSNLENIAENFALHDTVSFNFEVDTIENNAGINIIDESLQENVSAGDGSLTYNYEIVTEQNNSAVKIITADEPASAEFSIQVDVDNIDINDDENILNLGENTSYHIDLDLDNPIQGQNYEKSTTGNILGIPDSTDATSIASNKRILHGQQLRQGSQFRDPSTSDLENDDASSSTSQSLSIPSNNVLCTDQASFCCVDYKKLRKSTKPRYVTTKNSPVMPAEFPSTSAQGDHEMPGPSSSQSPSHERRRGSKKQAKSRRQVSEIVPEILSLDESQNIVLKMESQTSCQPEDKYLIFTKGSETYTPHQIGIKRIKRLKAFNDSGQLLPDVEDNTQGLERGENDYDEVDHLIDMNGHIIGMCLSPDQRY